MLHSRLAAGVDEENEAAWRQASRFWRKKDKTPMRLRSHVEKKSTRSRSQVLGVVMYIIPARFEYSRDVLGKREGDFGDLG